MHTATAHIPVIETDRLTLRAPELADWPGYCALLASPRSLYIGGPYEAADAWGWFASDLAHWGFFGHGALWIEERTTGETVGQTYILNPPHWPQEELGFMLLDGHEGRGYATEAAAALRGWYYGNHPAPVQLVSYVAAGNTGSAAIMARLDATRTEGQPSPLAGYDVYTHPAPERLQ
ncbi:GNAT family N-acetyltransferase [Dinoroseobacter sp. S76]|uniref:GNAT family N-acetyltransferase n=1 Tax=Dinoroseobacter sp. S76 TaxID=3415124 RepID=UPI003C7C44E3